MATAARGCMNCGNELNINQIRRGGKYCSRNCSANDRWGEPIHFGKLLTRSKAFVEVVKLCQTGLTQAEAARMLGLSYGTVHDWFLQHGTDAILQNRVCGHCGKPLNGMKCRSNRKYCSESCAWKARYARTHPDSGRMKFNSDLRQRALELYWGGLEGTFIARHLGVVGGTVHSWIHDFGHLRRRRREPEIMALLPLEERFTGARNAKEWRHILRANAPDGETSTVILVCETVPGNASVNYIATVILDSLSCDPCDGKIYAFCSQNKDQILTICWINNTYHLTKIPKSQGTYFWPEPKIGKQIIIQKNEFDYLITLRKKRGKTPYFT